ncbi:hypothetical protein C8F01DRAFT_1188472 [Mycena amicta]|nr:hypothetical protein C8F01DRAFT_1188472 [Mycena amicta]
MAPRKVKNSLPVFTTPTGSREVTPEPRSLPVLTGAPTTFAERHHLVPDTHATFLEHLCLQWEKDPKAAVRFQTGEGVMTVITENGGRAYFFPKQAENGKTVPGKPAKFIVVGQVGSIDDGTALGPLGATADGQGLVRWRFRLVPTTGAPSALQRLELRQRACFDNLIGKEEANEDAVHPGWSKITENKRVTSTEFLFAHSTDPNIPRDIITIQTESIYAWPEKGASSPSTAIKKPLQSPRKRNTVDGPATPVPVTVEEQDVAMDEVPSVKSANSTYPRSAWPACTSVPTKFTHLKQLDIRDVDGTFIPPWEMAAKFTPGTLVRATVSPVCWIFVKDTGSGGFVDKKYALIIKDMQIIAPVETEPEDHARSPAGIAKSNLKRKAVDDESDDEDGSAFQTFGASPAKKARV